MKARTSTAPTWIPGLVVALMTALAPNVPAQSKATLSPAAAQPANPTGSSLTGDTVPKDKPLPSKIQFSPWTTEIVKLAQAGVDTDIVLSYVDNCAGTFNLGADQIIHLSRLGVSSQVISVMIQHDAELVSGLRPLTASIVPGSEPTVHITFAAGNDAAARATGKPVTPPASTSSADKAADIVEGELDSDFRDLPEWESALSDVSIPGEPPTSSQPKAKVYAVRQPYPEELLPPILVVKAAVRSPNVLVIEFSR